MTPFGRHESPQRLASRILTDLLGTQLAPDAAVRLSETTYRRTYAGAAVSPQTFLHVPGPNDAATLEVAPLSVNTRRSLNRTRGTN